jgi:hypothetical protein
MKYCQIYVKINYKGGNFDMNYVKLVALHFTGYSSGSSDLIYKDNQVTNQTDLETL